MNKFLRPAYSEKQKDVLFGMLQNTRGMKILGRLPVVEDGAIIGIVTRSDVMLYFYDLLPDWMIF